MNVKRRAFVAELVRKGQSPKEAYENSKAYWAQWKHVPKTKKARK